MSNHNNLVESWVEEFRRAHAADPGNAGRQPFEDYWNWVKVFLVSGAAGQRGWLDQGETVLRGIHGAAAAETLRARIQTLGRTIAAEWAKDSRTRRIFTTFLQGSPNLRDWGRRLERAAAADAGDGLTIGRALDAIERDLRAALRS